ncbi:NADPH-dependent FMN reductase [Uliginosibacterium gangwonense]|uniref:NADPH-dependent FMN reductase n=1 Tax=Uliginosibacterium gangwonense TaxID=392736 RepID=UPI00037CA5FC|nr:NADPH-dependent FMN reductase [Uliginosibacterium gangwonense]
MSIAFISGSPSATSRSSLLLKEVQQRLASSGEETEWIAVRDLPATALLQAQAAEPNIAKAVSQVLQARAIVIASPIYKAAYSGLLKTFLDLLPQKAFEGKLVLPLSSAGSPLHVLALDFTIRPVLAALGVREVIPPVSVLDSQIQVAADGTTTFDSHILTRLDDTLELLRDRLHSQDLDALHRRTQQNLPLSAVPLGI